MLPWLLPLIIVAGLLVVIIVAGVVAWYRLTKPVAHIATGGKRRALYPPDDAVGTLGQVNDVQVRRYLRKLKSGVQVFGQIISLKDSPRTHILIFLHGYASNSDVFAEALSYFAHRGAIVVLLDLPCHGRSDGLLAYIPNWWAWVDQVSEAVDIFVPLARDEGNGRPMKVFISGMSMGGGVSVCLSIKRPSYFDGVVLVAPMLFVSDEVKPPKWVQKVFTNVVAPLLPKWPITPMKSLPGLDFRVPEQGPKYHELNPMSTMGLKVRLGSAKELGITFPNWMEEHMEEVRTPILILHGTEDKITDPKMSQKLCEKASSADKSIKLYDGAFHSELLCCQRGTSELMGMEWLPEQVATTDGAMADIANWLAARLSDAEQIEQTAEQTPEQDMGAAELVSV